MAIVATEITSIHGDAASQRIVFYRGQDSQGVWHEYGPIIIADAAIDPSSFLAQVAADLEARLADQEFNEVIQ